MPLEPAPLQRRAATRRRWACPTCDGVKLAPERARKDDTRTYCLPCSEKSGRLVKRVCEVAEARRSKQKEKATERAKRAKIKAREGYIVAGFDFERELARLWRHPAVKTARRNSGRATPKLHIRRGAAPTRSYCGLAHYSRWEIRLLTWPGRTVGDLLGTLLHEVVHMVGVRNHGPAFGRTLAMLAEAIYGIDAWSGVHERRGDWRGVQSILDAQLEVRFPGADRVIDETTTAAAG